MKKLVADKHLSSWRIHIIRNRQFGRKLVQSVWDFDGRSTRNQTDVEIVGADLFLLSGDYLLIECDNAIRSNCYFLIYFMYKARLIDSEEPCENNQFPQLFKFVSRRIFPLTNLVFRPD